MKSLSQYSGLIPARIGRGMTALLFGCLAMRARADEAAALALPDFSVASDMVANQEPAGAVAMPVSVLRFEPRVDVQARNLAEAQADVAIRGGIFENTGFKVGAVSLYDPQTGHYFAEIPVPPAMLATPQILTGASNALRGFNANVGTVAYGWRPIETRGEASLAGGEFDYHREEIYQGIVFPSTKHGSQIAAEFEGAHSESDGSVPFGDHDFQRIAGRIQLRSAAGQTDFFAGYQHKFFGWPNLYTPFGVNETENLQTVLVAANHRWENAAGDWLEAGAYYRRNRDDYEFNRFVPGQFNPYQHTTWTRGAAVEGRQQFEAAALSFSAQFMSDDLRSTSLVFGPYRSRTFVKLAAVPEKTFGLPDGDLTLRGGVAYDDSNRDKDSVSPVLATEWRAKSGQKLYLEYAETTQLPTYTALKSSPTAGLFRGNQNLGRETSRNLELGVATKTHGWWLTAAVFHRWDDALVDWTYRQSVPAARSANAVDIGTTGIEIVATRRAARLSVVLGYTYLHKNADYGVAPIDASFYALNFPTHRLTAALTWRLGAGFEIRSDNEYRVQERNALRTVGGDHPVLSSLGLYYLPPQLRGWEFSVQADNLWNSDFQEVPAVPAARRQIAAGVTFRW
jgi:vitamin B12 transporter